MSETGDGASKADVTILSWLTPRNASSAPWSSTSPSLHTNEPCTFGGGGGCVSQMLAAVPRAAPTLPSQRSDGTDEAAVKSELDVQEEGLEWAYPVAERTRGGSARRVHAVEYMDEDDEEEEAGRLTVTRPSLRPHATLRETALHSLRGSSAWHSGASFAYHGLGQTMGAPRALFAARERTGKAGC